MIDTKIDISDLIEKEVNALADVLYCNNIERDIVRKTIDGVIKATELRMMGEQTLREIALRAATK